ATSGCYSFSAAETGLPYLQTTNIGGGSIGFPYASFLLGGADSASIRNRSEVLRRKWAIGLFVQDTWKVTRKLTLDYGLRYDLETGAHELHDRSASFAPALPNPPLEVFLAPPCTRGTEPRSATAASPIPICWASGRGLAWHTRST